jgi:hypothetical protein
MRHATQRNQWKYHLERRCVWVRDDSGVMQQEMNSGKQCFVLGPSRGYITRTKGTSQSVKSRDYAVSSWATDCRRSSQSVAPGGSVGRGEGPIVVSRCVATPN